MTQYIDKSAVIAEIEKAIDSPAPAHDQQCSWEDGYWCGLYTAEGIIDPLEVKEMDLEDSIKETLAQKYINYTFKRHNIDPESKEGQLIYYAYMHGINQCLNQLKTQKGNKL